MTDILFVANPAARGFTGGLYRRIKTLLSTDHEVAHAWPTSPAEVETTVADASTRGVETIVVMGGDGVVHHAAQALVGGRSSLGIIPAGTANVLAKLLGLPERPLAAAKLIAEDPHIVSQPVARVTLTGESTSSTHYAAFNIGVGYDADVVARAEAEPDRKARLGSLHYAGNAFETVWAYRRRRPTMTVHVDSRDLPSVMTTIQLHHTYTYFGRVPMVVGDGERLSGMAVASLGMVSATTMALRSVRGRIQPDDRIAQFGGVDSLRISSADGVEVQADGEILGMANDITVELLDAALPVIVPPVSAD